MRRGNVLLVILVAVGIATASVGGYFWWIRQQPLTWEECIKTPYSRVLLSYPGQCVSPDGRKVMQPLSGEEKKNLQPPDETANWKIYESIRHKFSVKHPQGVSIKEQNTGEVLLFQWGPTQQPQTEAYDGIYLSFNSGTTKGKSLETFVNDQVKFGLSNGLITIIEPVSPFYLAGISGFRYVAEGLGKHTYFYVPRGTDGYIVITDSTNDPTLKGFKKVSDQILSTFRFD